MKLNFHSIGGGLLFAMFAMLGGAQTGSLSGPVLGYVLEASAVRPILGIPGASLMGDALPLGFEIGVGQVAPRGNYVLAVAAGGEVRVVALGGGPLQARSIPGAAPGPDRLVVSPTGAAALLVYSSLRKAQVITGLPDAPAAAALDLSGLPEAPGALGVSDDGAAVVAAAGSFVFLLTPRGRVSPLPAAGQTTRIAFKAGSHDALVAGPGGIGVIADVTGRPAFRLLPAVEGLDAPLGLMVAGNRVFVAASHLVASVDLATGAVLSTPCSCTITGLAPLAGDAVFRLTEPSSGPLWLMDAGGPQTRILFVPPATEVNLQ
jgi:hypothetical protein